MPASAAKNSSQQADLNALAAENLAQLQKLAGTNSAQMADFQNMAQTYTELVGRLWGNPEQLLSLQLKLYQNYLNLWSTMTAKMLGEDVSPAITPSRDDRRFSNAAWDNNLVFDFIKQSYLLTCDTILGAIDGSSDLSDEERNKVSFYTRQFLDAVAPTNFPLTNPEVLDATIESKGENLVRGLNNLLADIKRGDGKLKISMTDYDAFKVGETIATTPGDVVFRNRLIELIQYTPTTDKVQAKPLLIAPPWINRYYILDLRPENSFVKYALDQGYQVFMISWKNPTADYKDVGWEEYLQEGINAAIDATLEVTGEADLNMIGYCIGGTLLASGLAAMAKKKDKRVNTATFFTTLIDFSEAGELGVFIDEPQVQALERKMAERGYLDGSEMAQTFSMLRANDLIWNFVINNYLLGKNPFPFDLLYWNDDPTRMPCAMHSYYLRNMYIENNLAQKNKLKLMGETVDISQIDLPVYYVSAINDHITPWTGCFAPLHKFKQPPQFVLSKAGHVAGVANPPGKGKRAFWTAPINGADPEKWQDSASFEEGSWWPHWAEWLRPHSGKQVAAPKKLGSAKHKPLCPAPGTYVTEK